MVTYLSFCKLTIITHHSIEYTRVKIKEHQSSDYINASYLQYIDCEDAISDARPETVDTHCIKAMTDHKSSSTSPYRRYISTQGPLPATFNDFWQVVWEQDSRVLVMLTKEEEMNKVVLYICVIQHAVTKILPRSNVIATGHPR